MKEAQLPVVTIQIEDWKCMSELRRKRRSLLSSAQLMCLGGRRSGGRRRKDIGRTNIAIRRSPKRSSVQAMTKEGLSVHEKMANRQPYL